jgi:AraC-like DNA-binding protein
VSALWWCAGSPVPESVLPAGRAHLVFRLGGGWPAGVLHGPASRPRAVGPTPRESTIGVVFRPGGTRPFFDVPADAIADRSVALSELCGRDDGRLAGLTGCVEQPATLLDRIETALVAWADPTRVTAGRLVGEVRGELHRGCSITGLAARLATDRRILGRTMRREVGFGLKRYARLVRFEQALRAVRADDAPSLGLIAARFSFADQAHLTREFRFFAGLSPGRLHRLPGPTPWHVVQDEMFKTDGPSRCTLPS